ncbi:MAG: TlpA disulfide reductase family protein [Chloroflexi bacterium]|nr:TlpA disulfide reductase family protein [Chloroflexota bacterium]MDA1145234.1 TlpA disulfide reductase family protein [Chloroflexota bacterium]
MTTWLTPRHLIAVALVLVIGGLFIWREYGGTDAPSTVIAAGEAALAVEVGEPVPDFQLATPDGGTLRLSDFRGQAVVLNFWATWCGPCRAEMPELQRIHDEHSADGSLTVIGVDVMESPGAVTAFAAELELTFPMALDSDGQLFETFGLIGLPGTFFIDADGVLRSRVLGQLHGELLDNGLAAILGDAVAAR